MRKSGNGGFFQQRGQEMGGFLSLNFMAEGRLPGEMR